jgi:hypothetical protein
VRFTCSAVGGFTHRFTISIDDYGPYAGIGVRLFRGGQFHRTLHD